MIYDLEERTEKFGEDIIDFVHIIPKNFINKSVISQLVRSSTSIGANYMEANEASSKKDFRNKICIAKKESNESRHWLSMLARIHPEYIEQCRKLWKEATQLTLIFSQISRSCCNSQKN